LNIVSFILYSDNLDAEHYDVLTLSDGTLVV